MTVKWRPEGKLKGEGPHIQSGLSEDRQVFGPQGEVQPLCAACDISYTLFSDKLVVS